MKINIYQNVKSPKITHTITVNTWLKNIKESKHSALIETARKFGKGSKSYDFIKMNSIPCVTFNFLFKEKKLNSNIIDSTDLLFFDIDNLSFNPKNIDKSKIFAMYRSFGGDGYGIIVKVNGLTLQNYSQSFDFVAENLGITEFVDNGAKKATQYSILSYDKDIFVNNESFIYELEYNFAPPRIKEQYLSNRKKEKKKAYRVCSEGQKNKNKIRLNNFDELCIDNDYAIIDKNQVLIKCWKPYRKLKEGRNSFLLSYCNNLVYLNPEINKRDVFNILLAINDSSFEFPTSEFHINRVIEIIFKYKKEGNLTPRIYKKNVKVVFHSKSSLSVNEKKSISAGVIGKERTDSSIDRLKNIIINWDILKFGKISVRKIYGNFPISKKIVEKYYKLFAEEIKLKK
jgi:hypothetical protein